MFQFKIYANAFITLMELYEKDEIKKQKVTTNKIRFLLINHL